MTEAELLAYYMSEIFPGVYVSKELFARPKNERRDAFRRIGASWADAHRPPRRVA